MPRRSRSSSPVRSKKAQDKGKRRGRPAQTSSIRGRSRSLSPPKKLHQLFWKPYTDDQEVPDPKRFTRSIVQSIGTKGNARSIDARFNHTLRMPSMRVEKFLKFADKITIPFTLEELRCAKKNKTIQKDIETWCKELEKRSHASRPFSAQYFDKNGVPIFYYLGQRIEDEPPIEYTLRINRPWGNFNQQLENRELRHLGEAERQGKKIISDGLDKEMLISYHERTQHLFHHYQPSVNGSEKRHLINMNEENPRINTFWDKKKKKRVEERKGVLHLVQCWHPQGNTKTLGPGGTFSSSVDRRMAIENFYEASSPVAATLSEYFEFLFPAAYAKFRHAFRAGFWVKEDPGPWLGRALIYKLQGSLHVDDKDAGPTASFPCGFFDGGEMIVPEFDIKLSYKKGHICFFESTDIFHFVAQFHIPDYHSGKDNLTPGRIGSVFFTPKRSLDQLANKKPGWGYFKKFGRHPSPLF